jgi:hypothetical protein
VPDVDFAVKVFLEVHSRHREEFDEKAGKYQFDAGMSEAAAEFRAMQEIAAKYKLKMPKGVK